MLQSKSCLMQDFIQSIEIVTQHPIDVLLQGETGTGKDFWAQYVHHKCAPKNKFVAINCAAIPDNLAESELFGCEAGSFTGARKRLGKIELAHNGTLYLDEIDSMPLNIQAKLLRVLQDKGCERIGSSTFIESNFRLIASTKVDLVDLIQKKQFREDLYYRINTVKLTLPNLKQRHEDILDLFYEYMQKARTKLNIENIATPLNSQLLHNLLNHDWRGNIRELIALTQRYILGLPLQMQTK
jgi:transcriptional regulator with PAS, ATPase and Fis domain